MAVEKHIRKSILITMMNTRRSYTLNQLTAMCQDHGPRPFVAGVVLALVESGDLAETNGRFHLSAALLNALN